MGGWACECGVERSAEDEGPRAHRNHSDQTGRLVWPVPGTDGRCAGPRKAPGSPHHRRSLGRPLPHARRAGMCGPLAARATARAELRPESGASSKSGSCAGGDRPASPTCCGLNPPRSTGADPLRPGPPHPPGPGHRPGHTPLRTRRGPANWCTSTSRSSATSPTAAATRVLGRQPGRKNRSGAGYSYLHTAVDDHSRLAYSEDPAATRRRRPPPASGPEPTRSSPRPGSPWNGS